MNHSRNLLSRARPRKVSPMFAVGTTPWVLAQMATSKGARSSKNANVSTAIVQITSSGGCRSQHTLRPFLRFTFYRYLQLDRLLHANHRRKHGNRFPSSHRHYSSTATLETNVGLTSVSISAFFDIFSPKAFPRDVRPNQEHGTRQNRGQTLSPTPRPFL